MILNEFSFFLWFASGLRKVNLQGARVMGIVDEEEEKWIERVFSSGKSKPGLARERRCAGPKRAKAVVYIDEREARDTNRKSVLACQVHWRRGEW